MTAAKRSPRLARALLRRFVPADVVDSVIGDLEEVYVERTRRGGFRARAWYWRQALSFSLRFGRETLWEDLTAAVSGSLVSWIDVKLGARMLYKTPLLTITGCVAIATAIGINAGFNEFIRDAMATDLRSASDVTGIVRLENVDIETGAPDPRILSEIGLWREDLETVEHIGGDISLDLILVPPVGRPFAVDVSETSGEIFTAMGMVPEMGRPLRAADDGPDAEPVAIVAHHAWQRYFEGRADVVGRTVQLGATSYEVVGIAAEGYAFPSGTDFWVNMRRDPFAHTPRGGPPVRAFGRLARDRTLEEAEAELAQLGSRLSAEFPSTHERLRPRVTSAAGGIPLELRVGFLAARAAFVLLLIVACANVATLVFARNARRESEIAVRTALGAGRARIVTQLFAEALVLAVLSAGLGLVVARWGLRSGSEIFWEVQRMEPPFWFDSEISLPTVLYSLGLAVVGAAVVGILPALRATRGREQRTLQRLGSGSSGLSFGWLPTAVIVVQVAIAVALLPLVMGDSIGQFQKGLTPTTIPTERYLTARLLVDSEVRLTSAALDRERGDEGRLIAIAGVADHYRVGPTLLERYREMREVVAERLREEPGVRSVAYTSRLPALGGQSIPATRLEVAGEVPPTNGWYVRTATAELELYEAMAGEIVAGRAFTSADFAEGQRVALVNQAFSERILQGRNPVGQLVRDFRGPDGDGPWTEIVGVLSDDAVGPAASGPRIYDPLQLTGEYPLRMAIEVDGDPLAVVSKLEAVVARAAPGVILDEVYPLDDLRRSEMLGEFFGVAVLTFVALVTTLLATAGVYALMSFIVAQKTREIGIRTALGADPWLVVRGVFLRTLRQLVLGVAIGLAGLWLLAPSWLEGDQTREIFLAGGGVAAVLVVVGMIGCAIPVRRALRIQPIQALSAEC